MGVQATAVYMVGHACCLRKLVPVMGHMDTVFLLEKELLVSAGWPGYAAQIVQWMSLFAYPQFPLLQMGAKTWTSYDLSWVWPRGQWCGNVCTGGQDLAHGDYSSSSGFLGNSRCQGRRAGSSLGYCWAPLGKDHAQSLSSSVGWG